MQTLCKPQGQQGLSLLGLITHHPTVALSRVIHDFDTEVGREVLLAGLIQGERPAC